MDLEVFLGGTLAGRLSFDSASQLFAFEYDEAWVGRRGAMPLSPHLPLGGASTALMSSTVKAFFDNLLPEGRALDEAAFAYRISKSSLMGLLANLGGETAGALRILPSKRGDSRPPADELRPIPLEEMSERIRARASVPFSVWDQKVRLSIAGYQDKLAVYEDAAGRWFLAEGSSYASTRILKPEPLHGAMEGMTSNEFFCMRLARAMRLPVAEVSLIHVPEPVLSVRRFDRVEHSAGVDRLHVVDGCQLLNLSPGYKYERPYGDSPDVAQIRDGASYARLFAMLKCALNPALAMRQVLRWAIFQVLIGNTDAHAKNLSFFMERGGVSVAPVYDLVSAAIYPDVLHSYAMAIGDAFDPQGLSAQEWALFCAQTGLAPAFVQLELRLALLHLRKVLPGVVDEVIGEGAQPAVVHALRKHCLDMADHIQPSIEHIRFMYKNL